MEKDPFKEYMLELETTKKELGYSWYTAIGLQKVDELETFDYLKSVAIDNIDGNITIEKAEELIKSYYMENEKNVDSLYESFSKVEYFGRNEVINILSMSPAWASKFISKLLDLKGIVPVLGHGKGKYCFNINGVNYE